MKPLPLVAAVALTLAAVAPASAQHGAHVHGLVRFDLVIEPGRLTLQFDAPQEALLGHERSPRSAAERQAAAALLARLRSGPPLWGLDAALGCRVQRSEVQAPRLEAGAPARADDHAEVGATVEYACARPPRQLDLGPLLDAHPGVTRVEARVVAPAGQRKAGLKRPQRVLSWDR